MPELKPPRPYERISSDIILDRKLTEADLRLLVTLELKAGESRLAKVTPAWLVQKLGCHRTTIFRALRKGTERGYIVRQEREENGRLRVRLRPTRTPWCYAPRDLLESCRPFWQKHALLLILAQHRAGGGYSLRLYGKKAEGIITRCHLRRYTPNGQDWKQARQLLDDFIRELIALRLLALIDRATSRQPAICQIDENRLLAPHVCNTDIAGSCKGAE
jgi:hypothetical protein